MTAFVIAHAATGVLRQVVVPSEDQADGQAAPAGHVMIGIDVAALGTDPHGYLAAHYVADGAVLPRATIAAVLSSATIAGDGVEELVVSGLPDPCTVSIRGAISAGPTEVTGGELVLTCDTAGALRITIDAGAAWLPWQGSVEVT